MKEIDEYLELLYKNLNADYTEIKELKEEMKSHLLETIGELQSDGKSLQESMHIAIERFGDPNQINLVLPEILRNSNSIKQNELKRAEAIKQSILNELQKPYESIEDYNKIQINTFKQIGMLSSIYHKYSQRLSKDLKATHNVSIIDQMEEMIKTFKYHDGLLLLIAVIVSGTDHECPYFKDIAELGVMKLSDSSAVVDLAERAHNAKTEEDNQVIIEQIQQMKEGAEFNTYKQALDYNSSL